MPKWRPGRERAHGDFPQVQLTDFFSFSPLRSYRDPSFLHQKYLEEGLSVAQVAALTFSSIRTIRSALAKASIPLRTEDKPEVSSLPYGQKRLNGLVVPCKSELLVIRKMVQLRALGYSYPAITRIVNGLGMPSRKGKKWQVKVVFEILSRELD